MEILCLSRRVTANLVSATITEQMKQDLDLQFVINLLDSVNASLMWLEPIVIPVSQATSTSLVER